MDEHQQTLVNYIVDQLYASHNPDEVYNQLKAAGWAEERIHRAFLTVHAQVLPANMQAPAPATTGQHIEPDQPAPQANGKRRGRISTGWVLLKQSLRLLNGNRYLFRYLLMTWAIIMLAEVILCGVVFFCFNLFSTPNGNNTWLWYPFAFLSYVLIYCIINFYAAALAANIFGIFKGERKPYHAYIEAARGKAGPLFAFSVIEAIVGMFLRYVIENIRFVGWILAWLLGTTWSLGTMFALPMIMDTDVSAPRAIKRSIRFFKQTWGESVTAKVTVNAPLGLIIILVALVFWPILIGTILSGSITAFIVLLIVYLFIQITISIIGSFANSVVNVALYYYGATRQIPPGFSADMLNRVFIKRKRRFGKKRKKAGNARTQTV